MPANVTFRHTFPCTRSGLLFLALLGVLLLPVFSAQAADAKDATAQSNWQVQLIGHKYGPDEFLAINKKQQRLFMFEQRSPLALKDQFFCSTGAIEGDKLSEGDKRTPEGVYFVQRRLDSGLDYQLYGNLAFPLDYPNPVDRLKGKTGHGIWIHGRGHDLVPRETQGCMALSNDNMQKIDQQVKIGTPVVIAKDLSWSKGYIDGEMHEKIAKAVYAWANAWRSRDESFFSFYDPDKFSRTNDQSFDAFRAHKRGLFERNPWLMVMLNDVKVIAGPDYWVTYFGQYYRSPTFTSEGIKRLYWQLDDKGEPRIVGKEWAEGNLDLEETFECNLRSQLTSLIESWRDSWEKGDISNYMAFYSKDAKQGNRRGQSAIEEHKSSVWHSKPPKLVGIEDLQVDLDSIGVKVTFVQDYKAGKNYHDTGYKTLYLRPDGDGWLITREDWNAL